MKFDSIDAMSQFESIILEKISHIQSIAGKVEDETLHALNEYFKERLQLQDISNSLNKSNDYLITNKKRGESKVMFNEDLEMEWGSWKDPNFTDALLDNLNNTIDDHETILNIDENKDTTYNNIYIDNSTLNNPYWLKNPHSKYGILSELPSASICLPIPKLSIVLMAVGTRGDIQPFTQIGRRLQQDGHRVRIATHSCYRDYISASGFEFYPLGGDPHKLSEFMVKTHGNIIPSLADLINEVPKNLAMLSEIIHSCWGACVNPDPDDETKRQFIADAIISNPVTYGHIHCAEALGIPLHLMFPQPWLPTKAFPHPLSCMSYKHQWSTENYLSYQMVDQMLWLSMKGSINICREQVMGIPPIGPGDGGWNIVNYHKVPFVKMWSPLLVPKPKDWPDYVDIVGTFHELSSKDNIDYTPSAELNNFLSTSEPILFVGFGSMIIEDPESLIQDFLDAAALVNVKILIQTGWSQITNEKFKQLSKESEKKALLVKEFEDHNSKSVIFPTNPNSNSDRGEYITREKMDDLFGSYLSTNESTVEKNNDSKSVEFDDDDYVTVNVDKEYYDTVHISKLKSNQTRRLGLRSWLSDSVIKLSSKFNKKSIDDELYNLQGQIHDSVNYGESFDMDSRDPLANLPAIRQSNQVQDIEEDVDWDGLPELSTWKSSRDAMLIGPCPHSWLFTKVSAVIHHGGAGTTSAGLVAGLPTWICPFFGDQHFWGEIVLRRGLGPAPCPILELTLSRIADSMIMLLDNEVRDNAKKVSVELKSENGVDRSIESFYRHLPLDSMLCDVSIYIGESRLAHVYCEDCDMKLQREISDCIHFGQLSNHRIHPCRYKNWNNLEPHTPSEGFIQGISGLVNEVADGVTEAIYQPIKTIYQDGLPGAATGVVNGIMKGLIEKPLNGGHVLLSKLSAGFHGGSSTYPQLYNQVDRQLHGINRKIIRKELTAGEILKKRMSVLPYYCTVDDDANSRPAELTTGIDNNVDNNVKEENELANRYEISSERLLDNSTTCSIDSSSINLLSVSQTLRDSFNNYNSLSDINTVNCNSVVDNKLESNNDSDMEKSTTSAAFVISQSGRSSDLIDELYKQSHIHAISTMNLITDDLLQLSTLSVAQDNPHFDTAVSNNNLIISQLVRSNDSKPTEVTVGEDLFQSQWEDRQNQISRAYHRVNQLRSIMRDITKRNSRYLTIHELQQLVERAVNRIDIVENKSIDELRYNNNNQLVQKIVEQLSRGKDVVDFIDISLFHLQYTVNDNDTNEIIAWKHLPNTITTTS
eukprot:CAMPEP_0196763528 /NCGR_PEP_ID=MMETSP1095-20130614/4257_1 /TAXON_ID=96789 ORGANISM="Chromulina nebulosa, Strain UTEXLB2642" /NCGR_SAMPLE_ID=MMETSP1095 /ASSEMBLY_ACC=CAM_ASM_000446 /LENGTH=1269 /DNA_ID=CAMNT_0042116921 /DNA_START=178 /DNA_END=3987 /DNA_ORIENTATION=-